MPAPSGTLRVDPRSPRVRSPPLVLPAEGRQVPYPPLFAEYPPAYGPAVVPQARSQATESSPPVAAAVPLALTLLGGSALVLEATTADPAAAAAQHSLVHHSGLSLAAQAGPGQIFTRLFVHASLPSLAADALALSLFGPLVTALARIHPNGPPTVFPRTGGGTLLRVFFLSGTVGGFAHLAHNASLVSSAIASRQPGAAEELVKAVGRVRDASSGLRSARKEVAAARRAAAGRGASNPGDDVTPEGAADYSAAPSDPSGREAAAVERLLRSEGEMRESIRRMQELWATTVLNAGAGATTAVLTPLVGCADAIAGLSVWTGLEIAVSRSRPAALLLPGGMILVTAARALAGAGGSPQVPPHALVPGLRGVGPMTPTEFSPAAATAAMAASALLWGAGRGRGWSREAARAL